MMGGAGQPQNSALPNGNPQGPLNPNLANSMPSIGQKTNSSVNYAPNALQMFLQRASMPLGNMTPPNMPPAINQLFRGPGLYRPPPPGGYQTDPSANPAARPGYGNPTIPGRPQTPPQVPNPAARGPNGANIPFVVPGQPGYTGAPNTTGGGGGNPLMPNDKTVTFPYGPNPPLPPGQLPPNTTPPAGPQFTQWGQMPQGGMGYFPQWNPEQKSFLTNAVWGSGQRPEWATNDVLQQEFTNPNYMQLIEQLSGKKFGQPQTGLYT